MLDQESGAARVGEIIQGVQCLLVGLWVGRACGSDAFLCWAGGASGVRLGFVEFFQGSSALQTIKLCFHIFFWVGFGFAYEQGFITVYLFRAAPKMLSFPYHTYVETSSS